MIGRAAGSNPPLFLNAVRGILAVATTQRGKVPTSDRLRAAKVDAAPRNPFNPGRVTMQAESAWHPRNDLTQVLWWLGYQNADRQWISLNQQVSAARVPSQREMRTTPKSVRHCEPDRDGNQP